MAVLLAKVRFCFKIFFNTENHGGASFEGISSFYEVALTLNTEWRNKLTVWRSGSRILPAKRGEKMSEANLHEEFEKKQINEPALIACIDPLRSCDRLRAIREEFTSVARDCPYYDEKLRSRCLVDPHVIFIPECTGRSFSKGICCPKILQSQVEERRK
jgi:hypothetical protein